MKFSTTKIVVDNIPQKKVGKVCAILLVKCSVCTYQHLGFQVVHDDVNK